METGKIHNLNKTKIDSKGMSHHMKSRHSVIVLLGFLLVPSLLVVGTLEFLLMFGGVFSWAKSSQVIEWANLCLAFGSTGALLSWVAVRWTFPSAAMLLKHISGVSVALWLGTLLSVLLGNAVIDWRYDYYRPALATSTRWSDRFDDAAFRILTVGASRAEIIAALGEPLEVARVPGEREILKYADVGPYSSSPSAYDQRWILVDHGRAVVLLRRHSTTEQNPLRGVDWFYPNPRLRQGLTTRN